MSKALLIIDIQNDTPKNYKEVIDNINNAVDWAVNNNIHVIYIKHENLSAGSKNFKPGTFGSELATDLKIVSKNVFTKNKGSALTNEEFADFISKNEVSEFFIVGGDATICVKSTCFNLRKANYEVTVLSDGITSWSKKQIPDMIQYYESKGCKIIGLNDLVYQKRTRQQDLVEL
ncbi:isochorismatase family cysteine hydrolase [Pontibacter anaerobius]|uniref:Cysteine hydrolase n=1 Tax=Pontibacter anaerobius TaxID=2993940 RepID=A0ABT3REC0_9BACT|nr:isochorismatase family cysteine hydrolase [Pontibacter anaerobius]MCX2739779.1 cysteine hydrolase [Pontibacter anaerobius]